MRIRTFSFRAAAIFFLCTPTIAAATPSTDEAFDMEAAIAEKAAADRGGGIPNPVFVNVGGDDIGSATVIPGLPFADSGNTCSFTHQYDAVCPFTNPGAPDVVYQFTPAADESVRVSCCASSYDTKVYVYENAVGNLIACNDDACGADGWKSELECLPLVAGNTYYIVVDGYGFDCGTYDLTIGACDPCPVHCPPGGIAEYEVSCHDEYVDALNGGCESAPPAYTPIPCMYGEPVTMCGTYGGFMRSGLAYRDTDWYEMQIIWPSNVTLCATGVYDTLIGFIDADGGCSDPQFYDYALGAPCEETCLYQSLAPGPWWVFVATSGFGPSAGECGGIYFFTMINHIICEDDLSVEPSSWGSIKNLFR